MAEISWGLYTFLLVSLTLVGLWLLTLADRRRRRAAEQAVPEQETPVPQAPAVWAQTGRVPPVQAKRFR